MQNLNFIVISISFQIIIFQVILWTEGVHYDVLWRCDDVPMETLWCPYEDAMISLWRCYDVPMKMRWCPYEDAMMSLWRCNDVPMKMRWRPYEDAMTSLWRCDDVHMKMHGITMLRCSSDVQWRFAYQEAEEKKTVKSSSFHLPPLMKSVEDLSQNKKPRILLALINRQNKRSPHLKVTL